MNDPQERLRKHIERQAERMRKAEKEPPTLLAQTAFLGALGLMLVIPVILGAYLGHWLDTLLEGYSLHWTVGLIVLGLILGIINVYWMLRE